MTTTKRQSTVSEMDLALNGRAILQAAIKHVCAHDEIFDNNSADTHAYNILESCDMILRHSAILARYRSGV
jgi:hypothetical protein